MAGELFEMLSALGKQGPVPDSRADARWVTGGTFEPTRLERTGDLILGFVDVAATSAAVGPEVVTGLMRALFDEQAPARQVRASVGDVLVRAGRLPRLDPRGGRRPRPDPGRGPAPVDFGGVRPPVGGPFDPGGGRPPIGGPIDPLDPPDPDLPTALVGWDKLMAIGCVNDLQTGLATLGIHVAAVPKARPKQGSRIDSIAPKVAGVGDQVTITGSGFDATQRTDVAVYVGRRRAAAVSWSDTVVVFTVPAGVVGEACVSVLEGVDADNSAAANAVVAAGEVAAILSGCFGLDALGDRLVSGTAALLGPEASCGLTNRLWVGAPDISTFLVNGSSGTVAVRPTDTVQIQWVTAHADQVRLWGQVVSATPAPAALALPQAQVAVSDTRRLGPTGSRSPWEIEYVLTASNAVGTKQAKVRAKGTFAQAYAFLGAGTRSVFHAGALEYLPRACPAAPKAVSSTGLGALAALSAATGYGNVAPLVASWDAISPIPVSPSPFNARAWYAMSSLLVEDPAVRSAFESYERGMYVRLLRAVDAAVNEAMLSYADAPVVGDIAVAIADDETILEAKVVDALMESGMWVAKSVIGPALEEGGVSDSDMGKVTAPAKALVEEAIVGNAVGGGINAVGTALLNVNPVIAVVFVVIANVVKNLVEGALDIGKANALRAALAARALYGRGPLVSLIDDFISRVGLTNRTVGTPVSVALAASILETGEPAFIDGFAAARTARGGTIATLGWRNALLAVTAVPGATAPITAGVNLADASLTDGGPIEVLQRRDVDEILVIHSTCNVLPQVKAPDSLSTVGFLSLARRAERVRSASLAITGVEPDHFWPTAEAGSAPRPRVRHVMPTISLSNLYAFESEPGLMAIWRDYGYLRAFDVLAPTLIHPGEDAESEGLRARLRDDLAVLSDLIVGTRESAWRLEQRLNRVLPVDAGPEDRRSPPEVHITNHPDDLLALRKLKRLVRSLVVRRLELVRRAHQVYRGPLSSWPGDAVPRGRVEAWYGQFERHGYLMDNIAPIDPTGAGRRNPWLQTGGFSTGQNVPAETAPPSLDATLFQPLP